jgi:hypothetical protein
MLSLDLDDERKLVIIKHIGDVTFASLAHGWLTLLHTKAFKDKGYNLLSDYRGAKFTFKLNELIVARKFMKDFKTVLKGKKVAVITDEPYITAISTLFEIYAYEDAELILKIFATEKAALKWVMDCHYRCNCKQNACVLR